MPNVKKNLQSQIPILGGLGAFFGCLYLGEFIGFSQTQAGVFGFIAMLTVMMTSSALVEFWVKDADCFCSSVFPTNQHFDLFTDSMQDEIATPYGFEKIFQLKFGFDHFIYGPCETVILISEKYHFNDIMKSDHSGNVSLFGFEFNHKHAYLVMLEEVVIPNIDHHIHTPRYLVVYSKAHSDTYRKQFLTNKGDPLTR